MNPRGFIAKIHVQIANMDFDEIHVDLKKTTWIFLKYLWIRKKSMWITKNPHEFV